MEKEVLCKRETGFKYDMILKNTGIQYNYLPQKRLLKKLLTTKTETIYHIRYIKWRGILATLTVNIFEIILCKLRKIPIVWTCHNYYEHYFKFSFVNDILRYVIAKNSYAIIVFHPSIKKKLLKYNPNIFVSSFGDYSGFIKTQNTRDKEFERIYFSWLERRMIRHPNIVFIGNYSPFKRIDNFIEIIAKNNSLNFLLISKDLPKRFVNVSNNILSYPKAVFAELNIILNTNTIGIVGHDNLSVPTAIYLYASYKIPILGFDIDPIKSILKEYQIGESFSDERTFHKSYNMIRENYGYYSSNCKSFLDKNSWENARAVHMKIFN